MTLRELLEAGTSELDEAGIESPQVDAFYLLEYVCGINRTSYLLNKDKQITKEAEQAYFEVIERRAAHEPYQYITGVADFLGFTINVNENVLIPRLDSEILIEEALKVIPENAKVLDMCTGSGCLAIAIKCMSDVMVTASDISESALELARKNAAENAAEIEFSQGDLFEKLDGRIFDVIISNPPYVTEGEYRELTPEVKDHEPKLALTAGEDGLDIYRKMIPEAAKHLKVGGWLLMEMGCFQAKANEALLADSGYKDIKVVKDLAGLDRVIMGRKA